MKIQRRLAAILQSRVAYPAHGGPGAIAILQSPVAAESWGEDSTTLRSRVCQWNQAPATMAQYRLRWLLHAQCKLREDFRPLSRLHLQPFYRAIHDIEPRCHPRYGGHPQFFPLGKKSVPDLDLLADQEGCTRSLRVRPEAIALSRDIGDWKGRIRLIEQLGSDTIAHVTMENRRFIVRTNRAVVALQGQDVFVSADPQKFHVFRNGRRVEQVTA